MNITPLPVDLSNLARVNGRDFESSQIHGFEYDAASQRLFVQFKSNGARITYAYANISPAVAAEAEAAESKGKFFGRPFTKAYTVFERLPGYGGVAETANEGTEAA
jgi:hypothetical protein